MSPPPQTPAPRRFVFPKRQPTSTASTNRFVSTPRFTHPSSSVARPGTQLRNADIEDVEEEEERVEKSPVEGATQDDDDGADEGSDVISPVRGTGRRRDVAEDAIEVFSQEELMTHGVKLEGSFDEENDENDGGYMDTQEERSSPSKHDSKRRKLSITPLSAFSSPIPNRKADAQTQEIRSDDPTSDNSAPPSPSPHSHYDPSSSRSRHAQPTFHPAPRFKNVDEEGPVDGLPAAFMSPQRRGPKYLVGGLAAELQGWLSEVRKRESRQDGGGLTVVEVGEIRCGRRMHLVRGTNGEKVVLAGEGRLTGLGRQAAVEVGSMVTLGSPTWDVEIEETRWTVACDWHVQ